MFENAVVGPYQLIHMATMLVVLLQSMAVSNGNALISNGTTCRLNLITVGLKLHVKRDKWTHMDRIP
jgi:hypothetical protein